MAILGQSTRMWDVSECYLQSDWVILSITGHRVQMYGQFIDHSGSTTVNMFLDGLEEAAEPGDKTHTGTGGREMSNWSSIKEPSQFYS